MQNHQKNYLFNCLIKGLDNETQAQLNYMYSRACMTDELNHRREMEQMKKEITEDVMSRINIRLEDEALKKLQDMLNNLGK